MSKFLSKLFIVSFITVSVGGVLVAPAASALPPNDVKLLVSCYRQKPILRPRSNNQHPCVRELQILLKTPHADNLEGKGYDPGPIDGRYGPRTKAAVKRFQTDFNTDPGFDYCKQPDLLVDGIVGKYTWRALKCVYGTNDDSVVE